MAHWTRYDTEVTLARQQLRAYGLTRLGIPVDFLPTPISYKGQALQELAHRLELEDALREARRQLARMTDRLEAAGCVVITEQPQGELQADDSTTAPAPEAPPADCPVCLHKYPAFLFCSRCGPDCARCAVARADLPVPAPGVRRMWQVGVEGDHYHEHNENSVCAVTGCVPVEDAP